MDFLDPKSRLTMGQVMRYGYSGFLFALLSACVETARVKQVVDALGTLLATVSCVAIGVSLYVFYREVLAEYILYPMRHIIHTGTDRIGRWIDRKRGRPPREYGSLTAFLGQLGVPLGSRRWVYRTLQATSFVDSKGSMRFAIFHAEVHVLYISSLQIGAVGVYLALTGEPWVWLIVLSLVLLAICFFIDMRHDAFETMLMRQKREALERYLCKLGFGDAAGDTR